MEEQRQGSAPNENEPALRELAARLLAAPPYADSSAAEKPELFVGRLPENLPAEVPIPEGTSVVGSVAHGFERGGRLVQIVLDAELSAEHFRESYRGLLLAAGWADDERYPGRRGFVPRSLPGLFHRAATRSSRLRRLLRGRVPGLPRDSVGVLRLGDRGLRLRVTTEDRRDAPTDVRLHLVSGGRRGLRARYDSAWTVIPLLLPHPHARQLRDGDRTGVLGPPPGARERRGGGGGGHGPDSTYSNAVIETDLDLATVAAHYEGQLEEAGWSRTDGGQGGPQAWSTWTFTDKEGHPWIGSFTVLWLQGTSSRHMLHIRADRAPNYQEPT